MMNKLVRENYNINNDHGTTSVVNDVPCRKSKKNC